MNATQRQPIVHELKCHPGPFQAVKDGSKTFEWRKDDRGYKVGDTLWMREWDPDAVRQKYRHGQFHELQDGYTGDEISRTVTYIIREGFGIPDGYCIMGLAAAKEEQAKLLTDEEIERIRDEDTDGLYSDALAGFLDGLRYARDNGYLAPAKGSGLTVEGVMDCMDSAGDPPDNTDHFYLWAEKFRKALSDYAENRGGNLRSDNP